MSRRWPGWEDLPRQEIAPIAEWARENGRPFTCYYVVAGLDGSRGAVDRFHLDVTAEGEVTLPGAEDTWEAVIEDGGITGVRLRDGSADLTLVRAPVVVVPSGENAHSPIVYAPDPQGLCVGSGDLLDAIDSEAKEPNAVLHIQVANADGSFTDVAWGLTAESAASVIALIRNRHGEPINEILLDAEGFEKGAAAVLPHIISTRTCLDDCDCQDEPDA